MGSPHEINNLKQQLQDTKKKLEGAEKQVEEKSKLCTELENKMKVIIKNKELLKIFSKPQRFQFVMIFTLFIDLSNSKCIFYKLSLWYPEIEIGNFCDKVWLGQPLARKLMIKVDV